MSQHPLQHRLEHLRSRVLRLLLVRGLSTVVASVLALAILLGLLDYAVRFRDRGVLVLSALSVLAVFLGTGYRLLRRLLGARLDDTALALQIEACYPAIKDRLASAVEFLKQSEGDPAAGSAAMRRAAVAQATARCDEIDFSAALNLRPAFRAALASLAVCLVAAGLAALNPGAVRTALARLAMPLGNAVWPQQTHLKLKNPVERLARGRPLEIEVIDAQGTRLPGDCVVHYRLHEGRGKVREEQETMRPLGQTMIVRRENVTRSLEFRVTGGDDRSMPWMPVEVLDPSAVSSLSIDVFPPQYTNWPRATRDAASAAPILGGSRVELAGEANKPLRSAVLHLENGSQIPAEIEGDGRKFHVGKPSPESPAGLVLEKSISYTILLEDRDGIRGGEESWQFRVLPDAAPTALIQRPSTDLFVTPVARVDLRIDAHDDVGLRSVALVYASSGTTIVGEKTISLYEGPPQPAVRADAPFDAAGQRLSIDRRWDIEELKLQPGTQLTIFATADDYRSQTGRSQPRTITIITPEELQGRLAARQAQILAELARWLQLQRDTRGRVRDLELRLHETGELDQAEIDRLQSADFNQRRIVQGLTDRSEGLPALVSSILTDLEMNRVDNSDFARRMQGLLDEFDRLQREHLAAIGDELTVAIKGSQFRWQSSPRPTGRDAEDEARLVRVGEHQQQVIQSLEDSLAQLRQWDDYRRFQRDVAQLLHDQEDVARGAADLARLVLGRDWKELSPRETADLKALVERQFELARRETRIEQEMEQSISLLRPNEPLAADALGDAFAEARRLAIAAEMLAVGGKLRDNGLGQAPADHQKILQDLQTILDILANNRAQDSQRLGRELDSAAKDLDGLRKRQGDLRRKFDELQAAKDQLSEKQKAEIQDVVRRQEEIRQETLQLGRRLKRLLADEPAKSAEEAADKMKQAGNDAADGKAANGSRHAKEAEELLRDTEDKLGAAQTNLRVRLALEKQARLEDAIKHLHRQQKQVEAETHEYATVERTGPLTRAQVFGLLELARQQALLRDETERMARSPETAGTFRLGLSAAAKEMGQAAGFLQDQQTGAATQQAEQAAIARLALLIAAFEPESNDNAAPDKGGGASKGGGSKASGPSAGITLLAEIKFLKLWQEDLNRRTQQVELDAASKPADDLRRRYAALADEQARLAEATMRFVKRQNAEGNPPDKDDAEKKVDKDDIEK